MQYVRNDDVTTAIIILNYRGWRDTIVCLESLLLLSGARFDIFVVDNASPDDSVRRIEEWAAAREVGGHRAGHERNPRTFLLKQPCATGIHVTHPSCINMRLIVAESNRGYAAGNNLAIREALKGTYDFFWILNNDTAPDSCALAELVARTLEDARIGLCGSTLVYRDAPDLVQNRGGGKFLRLKGRGAAIGMGDAVTSSVDRNAIESELDFVSGASALATRKFLETVGLMSEDYFLYWEEMDWSARNRGRFKLAYAPQSIVYHQVGASIGTRDGGEQSSLADYYMTRNRLKFCARYSRTSLPFAVLDVFRSIARRILRGDLKRAWVLGRAALGIPYNNVQGAN